MTRLHTSASLAEDGSYQRILRQNQKRSDTMSQQEKTLSAEHQAEALDAINKLSQAIEKRRLSDAEVGKAHKEVLALRVKTAVTSEALSAALKDFSEVADHW
jgi:hypothetical protein